MTTTDIIYNILERHHELTAGAIFKKCAGIKSIGNQKTVSNALTRLKNEGRVQNVCDQDKGLWLWSIVRNGSPEASIGCDSDAKDPLKPRHDAFDITEINHESIVETQQLHAHEDTDDASQTPAADAIQVSNQAEAEAGWTTETVADTSNVLGISVQARHEASPPKPATPIPVGEAIAEYASYRWGEKESYLEGFLYGIAFAERYHNIFDAD